MHLGKVDAAQRVADAKRRNTVQIQRVARALETQQQQIELLVLAEPSGPRRNELTSANIHLLGALEALRKAGAGQREI